MGREGTFPRRSEPRPGFRSSPPTSPCAAGLPHTARGERAVRAGETRQEQANGLFADDTLVYVDGALQPTRAPGTNELRKVTVQDEQTKSTLRALRAC